MNLMKEAEKPGDDFLTKEKETYFCRI